MQIHRDHLTIIIDIKRERDYLILAYYPSASLRTAYLGILLSDSTANL